MEHILRKKEEVLNKLCILDDIAKNLRLTNDSSTLKKRHELRSQLSILDELIEEVRDGRENKATD